MESSKKTKSNLVKKIISFEQRKPKLKKSKSTIPTGQNPSGSTLSLERRKHLCQIASAHDLIILEDDPYYYLQFKDPSEYFPSLFSLDTDQRVLRFDSFSKIISSGIRYVVFFFRKSKIKKPKIELDL